MTAQIETKEQFDNALQALLLNEETREATIDKLLEVFPGNDVVKMVAMFLRNEDGFGDWVREYVWRRVS